MVHEGAGAANSVAKPTTTTSNEATVSFAGVTIKQEKITPPGSPSSNAFINGTYLTPSAAGDDKTTIGPVKSSSEILGELFQVFSATVPDDLVNARASKKKHKKEKKSKKSRNKEKPPELDGDQPPATGDGVKEAVRAKRKHRDGKRTKEAVAIVEKEASVLNADDLQAAKLNERKRRFETVGGKDDGSSNKEQAGPSKQAKASPINMQPGPTTVGGASNLKAKPNKIVFKSLKDSSVFKNNSISGADGTTEKPRTSHRQQQQQQRGTDDVHSDNESMGSLSELSLSDEETYLRERNTFWKGTKRGENPFYAKQPQADDNDAIRSISSLSARSGTSQDKNGTPSADAKPADSESWRFKGSKLRGGTGYVSEGDSDVDEDGNKKPFQAAVLKKTKEPIVMNIRNAVSIQPKTVDNKKAILANLARHQHRRNEGNWVPVQKKPVVPSGASATTFSATNPTGVPNMALPPPVLLPVLALAAPAGQSSKPQIPLDMLQAPPPPPPPPAAAAAVTANPQPARQHNRMAEYPQLYASFIPSKSQNPLSQVTAEQHHNGYGEQHHQQQQPPANHHQVHPTDQTFDHNNHQHRPLEPLAPPLHHPIQPPPFIPPQHELPTSLNFPPPPIELVRKKQQELLHRQPHNNQPRHQAPQNYKNNPNPNHYHDMDQADPHHSAHPMQPSRNRNPFRQPPPRSQNNPHSHNPSARGSGNPFRRPNFDFEPNHFDPPSSHPRHQADDMMHTEFGPPDHHDADFPFDDEPPFDELPPMNVPHHPSRSNPLQMPHGPHGPGQPQLRPRFPMQPHQSRPVGRPANSTVPLFHQLPLFHQQRIRHHLQQMHEDQMRREEHDDQMRREEHDFFDDDEFVGGGGDNDDDDAFSLSPPPHPDDFIDQPTRYRSAGPSRPMFDKSQRQQHHPNNNHSRPNGPPPPHHHRQRFPPAVPEAPHGGSLSPARFRGPPNLLPNRMANPFAKPNPFAMAGAGDQPMQHQPSPINAPYHNDMDYHHHHQHQRQSPGQSTQQYPLTRHPGPHAGPAFREPIDERQSVPSIVEQRLNAIRNLHDSHLNNNMREPAPSHEPPPIDDEHTDDNHIDVHNTPQQGGASTMRQQPPFQKGRFRQWMKGGAGRRGKKKGI